MSIDSRIIHDGHKNVVVNVTGQAVLDIAQPVPVLELSSLQGPPKGVKIDSITFACEDKMTCLLWWGKDRLILPLAGRGRLDFEGDDGLQGRDDIYLTIWHETKRPKNFLLILNITKQ
jgi:hypothetical protein